MTNYKANERMIGELQSKDGTPRSSELALTPSFTQQIKKECAQQSFRQYEIIKQ